MPELVEQMYCSQQIVIPPKYPYILKRFCKAAIKTQPYDLLRWSFEYFKALSQHRPPPVKLRLEYPIYSTEGGLTRGCLKVLAHQLSSMKELPLTVVRAAWKGFCLDPVELRRIFCLCEVYLRCETVPFLHFIAVAGGLLTKSLTHTMILLCESLTEEPDGGSAAIPVADFTRMYKFLASMDASSNVKYLNGYREGEAPTPEEVEEEESEPSIATPEEEVLSDEYWQIEEGVQRIDLINSHVGRSTQLSNRLNEPPLGKIEHSPSIERIATIEWQNFVMERKGRPLQNPDIDSKLRAISVAKLSASAIKEDDNEDQDEEKKPEGIIIIVFDEEDNEIPYELYGEPKDGEPYVDALVPRPDGDAEEEEKPLKESQMIVKIMADRLVEREMRIEHLLATFDEIAALVDRYKSANYDLGMVAGRQMSSTSGEFIVQSIEKEILAYIDDQIAILPDPDLKKKKAKPEEVAMIRDLLEEFLDENMHIIVPELEEVEEEEEPLPEITQVYAVPGIGPPVDMDTMMDFVEYAREQAKVQSDMFLPRNIRHFLCPPLENYPDLKSEKTEQIPVAGIMTH